MGAPAALRRAFGCWTMALLVFASATPAFATGHYYKGLYALFNTDRGSITARLFFESAPLIVGNFVGLAEGSLTWRTPQGNLHTATDTLNEKSGGFYDGLTFHRVVTGFIVQSGDPSGDGSGGTGYWLPDEFSPALNHAKAGMLSMANKGPHTNGSQFFITLTPAPWLNFRHSVFGEVTEGLELLRQIQPGDRINKVTILRIGEQARRFDAGRAVSAGLRRWFATR